MENQNGNGREWGEVKEIRVSEIPPSKMSRWHELFADVSLRLETTSFGKALVYSFDDPKIGEAAFHSLQKFATGKEPPFGVCRRRVEDETRIFVYPGEKKKKQYTKHRIDEMTPEASNE